MSGPYPSPALAEAAVRPAWGGLIDAAGLTDGDLTALEASAERIRRWQRGMTKRIFLIGVELASAKALLGHGRFGAWLDAEFGWSERTAQRFLGAVEVFGDKADTVSVLKPSAIYALSAKSTPPEVRAAVMARLDAGEFPPVAEVKAEVAAAREELRLRAARAAAPKPSSRSQAEQQRRRVRKAA